MFENIYNALVKKYLPELSDSQKQILIDKKVYAIDSTTIKLFQPIFDCVGRNSNSGKRKGGLKSHQKLDMQAGIPVKIYHSDAKEHDSTFIHHKDIMRPNEVAVMDKAYNSYELFDKWTKSNIFFVTILKNNAQEEMLEEFDLKPATPDNILRHAKYILKIILIFYF